MDKATVRVLVVDGGGGVWLFPTAGEWCVKKDGGRERGGLYVCVRVAVKTKTKGCTQTNSNKPTHKRTKKK